MKCVLLFIVLLLVLSVKSQSNSFGSQNVFENNAFYGKASPFQITLDGTNARYTQLLVLAPDHMKVLAFQIDYSITPISTVTTPFRVAVGIVVVGKNEVSPPNNFDVTPFSPLTNPTDQALGYKEIYPQNPQNLVHFEYVTIANPNTFQKTSRTYQLTYPMPIHLGDGDAIWLLVNLITPAFTKNTIYNEEYIMKKVINPFRSIIRGDRRQSSLNQKHQEKENKDVSTVAYLTGIISFNNHEGLSSWINDKMQKQYVLQN